MTTDESLDPSDGWDCVVIGSGPGGLTAAAYLAASGKRVLVLEQHDLAGGNAQVFRRHHEGAEFEFDVGVHYLGDCGPGGIFPRIFESLGVGDRMTWNPLDSDGFDLVRIGDLEIRTPTGWDAYTERLANAVPGDAEAIRDVMGVLRTVATESKMALIPGMETPNLDTWRDRNVGDLFAEYGLSPAAVAALDYWAGLYAGAPSESSVAMHATIIDHYMTSGAYYPAGGGQMIPARLCQVVEACGGEVRTLATVEEILLDDGRVRGVRLAGGEVIDSPLVVSNADYKRTVLELTDRSAWSASTVELVQTAEMTLGLIVVYVAVDTVLEGPNVNYLSMPSVDMEGYYATLEQGRLPDEIFAYISMASRKDPGNPHLCPQGYTNFQIMTLAPRGYRFWGVDAGPAEGGRYRLDGGYRDAKADITDRLLDAGERLLGPFRDHIVHVETATPLTHERYTRSTGGTSYGFKHTPAMTGPGRRPSYRTEVEGLWVVGANTMAGHGIAGSMVGGAMCAGEILDRAVFLDAIMGTRLVDPDRIPPDGEDFDPVEFCRGAALRERRAEGRRMRAVGSGVAAG